MVTKIIITDLGTDEKLARDRDALNVMGGQQPVHSFLIRLAHVPAAEGISGVL